MRWRDVLQRVGGAPFWLVVDLEHEAVNSNFTELQGWAAVWLTAGQGIQCAVFSRPSRIAMAGYSTAGSG